MSKTILNEVEINGITYVQKGTENSPAKKVDGLEYVLVRTRDAGVFAGYLSVKEFSEYELVNARRIWYWSGAASLSQLSIDGTNDPDNCKFPEAVNKVTLFGVIEVLYPTEKARESIEGVKTWKAQNLDLDLEMDLDLDLDLDVDMDRDWET